MAGGTFVAFFVFGMHSDTHTSGHARTHTHAHTMGCNPSWTCQSFGQNRDFPLQRADHPSQCRNNGGRTPEDFLWRGESTHADTVASVMYSHTNNNTHSHIKIHRIDRFWTLCIPAGCMRHFNTHLHSRKPPCGAHGRMGIFVVTYRKSGSGMWMTGGGQALDKRAKTQRERRSWTRTRED